MEMNSKKRLAKHLKDFTNIGTALSTESDINKFFQLVLNAAIEFTNCDGGTIYLISENKKFLDFKTICTLSKNLLLGMADTAKWPSIPLFDKNNQKIFKNFASYVANTKKACCIDDVYHQNIFDNSGTQKYDTENNYNSKSMAAIPMMDHEKELLGVIQLINAMDENGEIIPFSDEHLSSLTSLASLAAVALTNRNLIDNLEKLLLEFLQSIATAIDRESKYTSGHIKRVAKLSDMLANAVQNDNAHYSKTKFSENELQELSIASWMHDIGKITTPTHIRDKSTKLEIVFDRIELVLTRFDFIEALIKKDIFYLKNDVSKKELNQLLKLLKKYRKFIIKMNSGGEFLENDAIDKIEEIAEFHYLSDEKEYYLINDNEKNNLLIKKGTFLPEEYEKMREHVIVTHEMLSQLTFPKKFKNVPKFAASHHELLNGKGYPFGLTADELPIQSRIITIADLFEALTSSDRPYKKMKTLTETLKIMAFQVRDNCIDEHLFNLFLDSKIYLQYAKTSLDSEQIDDVNIPKIKEIYHENNKK
jgi:HD-GYP domain-containing protein (c-di-GMP phosphodiesterase class II)